MPQQVEAVREAPGGTRPLPRADRAGLRVQLARRFLNDVVSGGPGGAPEEGASATCGWPGTRDWPAMAEFDDTPPEALAAGVFT